MDPIYKEKEVTESGNPQTVHNPNVCYKYTISNSFINFIKHAAANELKSFSA